MKFNTELPVSKVYAMLHWKLESNLSPKNDVVKQQQLEWFDKDHTWNYNRNEIFKETAISLA